MGFFTSSLPDLLPALGAFQKELDDQRIACTVKRALQTFGEVVVEIGGERLKIDLAVDSPYRLNPTVFHEDFGIFVDDLVDIACNKLSALFDRADPKDFVDIYFVHRERISIPELVPHAKKKHIGLDEYWLARAFFSVREVSFLPRMIKNVTIEELKEFFLTEAERLME